MFCARSNDTRLPSAKIGSFPAVFQAPEARKGGSMWQFNEMKSLTAAPRRCYDDRVEGERSIPARLILLTRLRCLQIPLPMQLGDQHPLA